MHHRRHVLLAADVRTKAKNEVKSGQCDRGDRKRD